MLRVEPRKLLAACGLLLLIPLGGCQDYLVRGDLISPTTGDSVAFNRAVQVIDPWPRAGFDLRPSTEGSRMTAPMDRYKAGGAVAEKTSGGSSSGTSTTSSAQ